MGLLIGLIFLGVFAVAVLVMMAAGSGASEQAKQVHATLDSALATDSPEVSDQRVNLRKDDLLSSIPWLNRKLLQFDIAPRLQTLLYQADSKWTAGVLLAICGLCFVVGFMLIDLRFNSLLMALPVGLLLSGVPFLWVFHQRQRRLDKFQQGLPEALDLMVSALRAGHSLVAALGSVARECADPIGCEFKACFEEQNYGLELKTALDNLLKRVLCRTYAFSQPRL